MRAGEPPPADRGRERGGGERVPVAGHAGHGGRHGPLLRGHPRRRQMGHDGGALHAIVRGGKYWHIEQQRSRDAALQGGCT